MARIPVPERGQPLDLTYIYQIVNAVNEMSSELSPSVYKYVTVDTPAAGKQSLRASEARFIAGFLSFPNSSTINAGNEKTFSYSFPTDFKFPPIVTATLVNIGNTAAGKDVSVVITNVTTSSVDGLIKFNTSGDVSIGVNFIAIGIPN
jgi:hypothetical protein